MWNFIKAVIHPTYWFTHQHPVPEAWKLGLTIFFGALIGIGIAVLILASMKKFRTPMRTLFRRVAAFSWVMGLVGYTLLFFSVEQVAFLSARLFYLLWFAGALFWICVIAKYAINDVPRLIEQQDEKMRREQYLPKKK